MSHDPSPVARSYVQREPGTGFLKMYLIYFLAVLGFELRASHLLGTFSTT
jgi:hypothetical protein